MDRMKAQGLKARRILQPFVASGFQPLRFVDIKTLAVGQGWYAVGPLALSWPLTVEIV